MIIRTLCDVVRRCATLCDVVRCLLGSTMIYKILIILALAFIQNISFSIVSRSRNRDNVKYHLIAATFSNTVWFLTFRQLIKSDMNFILFLPYVLGTVLGSCFGIKISMRIEKFLGASAENHLNKPTQGQQK